MGIGEESIPEIIKTYFNAAAVEKDLTRDLESVGYIMTSKM